MEALMVLGYICLCKYMKLHVISWCTVNTVQGRGLFNQLNYPYPYMKWVGLKPEVGVVTLK